MAALVFSKFDARKILGLPDARDVDALVKARILDVTAYDPRGRPLFAAESLRRAAARMIQTEAPPA